MQIAKSTIQNAGQNVKIFIEQASMIYSDSVGESRERATFNSGIEVQKIIIEIAKMLQLAYYKELKT